MHLRVDPEHHLSRKSLLWLLADSGARFEVILDRLVKSVPQAFNRVGMEAHPVANAGDPTGEDTLIVVVLNAGPNSPCNSRC